MIAVAAAIPAVALAFARLAPESVGTRSLAKRPVPSRPAGTRAARRIAFRAIFAQALLRAAHAKPPRRTRCVAIGARCAGGANAQAADWIARLAARAVALLAAVDAKRAHCACFLAVFAGESGVTNAGTILRVAFAVAALTDGNAILA